MIVSSSEASTSSDNDSSESSKKISNKKSKKSLSLTPVSRESTKKAIKKSMIVSSSEASTSSDNGSSESSEKISNKKRKKSLSLTPVSRESTKKAIKKSMIVSSSEASTSSDNGSSESSEKISNKKRKKSLSLTPVSRESTKKAIKKILQITSPKHLDKVPTLYNFFLFVLLKHSSTWSVVSLLTLVCQTVSEVQDILHCLVRSSCLVHDILECFYCLASIFYHLATQNRIDSGLHYRVYYALYLYENSYQTAHSPIASQRTQRSLGEKLKLTHEQVRILKHDVNNGEVAKIVAFAGTGKTTTLVQYTKMRPRTKFLNVVYNKSTQLQAVEIFPSNVESRTIHSLAYQAVGFRYKAKLAFAVSGRNIMNALPSECGFLHARRVEDTLKNFIASASTSVKKKHIPEARVYASDLLDVRAVFGDQNHYDESYFQSEIYLKSFRFGPEIAYVASSVLDVLKGVRDKTLVGVARKGETPFILQTGY
ncbi:PREDICTED: F-box DNA helicase 1-like [Acropora digitifera]|uniref:F-box DNA helicase 1-like n=1 Tax=Acropora digitifera TaxID=70779 RepID=UPI00077A8F2C|nr:PREDICTED: F-box DNA helicase 1-like [Acropora digitifera]